MRVLKNRAVQRWTTRVECGFCESLLEISVSDVRCEYGSHTNHKPKYATRCRACGKGRIALENLPGRVTSQFLNPAWHSQAPYFTRRYFVRPRR